MHKELNLEIANIFAIDSKEVTYNLNANQVNTDTGKIKDKNVNTRMVLRNITESSIVVRVRTNKKENYAVNPTYFVLEPNGTKAVEIELYAREETVTAIKEHHKFCVEAIIIENEYIKNEPKSIFGIYQKNKKKVFGQISKYKVNIIIESEEPMAQSMLNPKNIMTHDMLYTPERKELNSLEESGEIFQSTVMNPGMLNNKLNSSAKNEIKPLSNNAEEGSSVPGVYVYSNSEPKVSDSDPNSNNKDNLEELKINCHKLEEELEKVTNTYEDLKKTIEAEKEKDKNTTNVIEPNAPKKPEIKEKKVSNYIVLGICAFSVILGFYLTK